MRAFLLIVCLGCSLMASDAALAQGSATEQVVNALFKKPERVQWFRHYHGRIDGFNEVAVALGDDGKRCKGFLTYLRSKEALQLEGTLKNDWLDLREINREGAVSGRLRGTLRGQRLVMEWTNVGESVAGLVELAEVPEEVRLPSYCGSQMWVRCFRGRTGGKAVRMIVQRIEEGQLRGTAYLESKGKTYRLFGEVNEVDQYRLVVQSADHQVAAEIEGVFGGASQQRAIYKGADGVEQYLLLDLESNHVMGCVEYADYLSSYDVTYPKTSDTSFNRWMEAEVDHWLQSCRDYTQTVREIHPKPKPPLRASVRAYAWSDIDYYSPRLISGFLTYHNTWTLEPEGRAFNYDLQSGREISREDVFHPDFEVDIFVLEYLHRHQLEYQWYQDQAYRKWLAGRDFPHFTIRQEGLCFGTAFNVVYGRHELTIPYAELKPHLKQRSPIAHLVP